MDNDSTNRYRRHYSLCDSLNGIMERNMEKRTEYKGYIISSAPLPLQGGDFSSNGSIEYHSETGVTDTTLFDLQAIPFPTEDAALNYYIESAKKIIDQQNQIN